MFNKRVISLFAALLVIVIIAIWIFPPSPPEKIIVHITILENTYIQDYKSQLIEQITKIINEKQPSEIEFSIHSSSLNNKINIPIKRGPADSDPVWEQNIKNGLEKALNDSSKITLSNSSANDIVVQIFKLMIEPNNTQPRYFILTGSFPTCYDDSSLNQLIEKTAIYPNENISFVWSIIDSREREKQFLSSLKEKSKISTLDRSIVLDKSRDCIESKKSNVYGVFFNNLEANQSNYLIKELLLKFEKGLSMTIWNDGPMNNSHLMINQQDSILKIAQESFQNLEKAKWSSISYLLKQAVNTLSQSKDSSQKELYLIGPMPPEGPGSQLDSNIWSDLKNIKNIKLYYFIPKGSRKNETDKTFLFGLSYHKIKFEEI